MALPTGLDGSSQKQTDDDRSHGAPPASDRLDKSTWSILEDFMMSFVVIRGNEQAFMVCCFQVVKNMNVSNKKTHTIE